LVLLLLLTSLHFLSFFFFKHEKRKNKKSGVGWKQRPGGRGAILGEARGRLEFGEDVEMNIWAFFLLKAFIYKTSFIVLIMNSVYTDEVT